MKILSIGRKVWFSKTMFIGHIAQKFHADDMIVAMHKKWW